MNALTKFSIALLLVTATAIAAYLFLAASDEGFDAGGSQSQEATSSQPQDGICKQDEERLARLRANPSLDEGLSFVSEMRCLRLWPQLQAIMDRLGNPSRPTATSRPSGASDTIPASNIASGPATTSAALDDACKDDEDRLAELRANPSVEAAIRFDSELKCPRLQPQLPAILKQLSKTEKVEAANQQAPASDTMSTRAAAPPASLPSAPEVTSATADDACKRDEQRLAELQAKPSRDEAVRFEDEVKCSRLQPQVLALLDSLNQLPQSAGTSPPDEAPRGATSAREAAPPALEPAPETKTAAGTQSPSEALSNSTTAGEMAPRASEPPTTEAESAAGAFSPNGAPPDTPSAGDAASRTLEPPVSEATSGAGAPSSSEAPLNTASAGAADTNSTSEAAKPLSAASESASAASDDACKRDERRLANLQANPTADEAIRLERELTCTKLAPQLLAILDRLSGATEAAPTSAATGAVDTNSAREAAPRPSATPARGAPSTVSNAACKQDEERLARLRTNPSSGEATRFAQELRCEALRPELVELAEPPPMQTGSVSNEARGASNAVNDAQPPSQTIADAERRIAVLEKDKEALAAEVSRLQRNQVSPSAEQPVPPASPPPSPPAERSEPQFASNATEDAERRIAALESEKEALAAEVSKLQHDREAPPAEQGAPTPSPQPASPAERSEAEASLQAAADAERRIAELESEKVALTDEVSKLQRGREASSAEQPKPTQPPPPAAAAERSNAEPAGASAALPTGMPVRVPIRYLKNDADARAQAEKLASALAAQNVDVADVRESRTAIRTELSFFYAPDETLARQVGRLVGVAPVRRLQPKDALMARPGTIELNLSGDSHFAAIKATSSRESNHE
jgi:hypothetical protein